MKRDVDLSELTDGKKYTSNDLVKLGCHGCLGCSDCCKDRGSMVVLDPYDIFCMTRALNMNFDALLSAGLIRLDVIDGLILPGLGTNKKGTEECCVFLNEEGLCKIHGSRPGICRLFPLGRLYDENGDFSYILQVNECTQPDGAKAKVSKWLGIPELTKYEQYIRAYHAVSGQVKEILRAHTEEIKKKISLGFLNALFRTPYDPESSFYEQFESRLNTYFR